MEPAPGRLVPPNLTAELAFAEPSGNDALDGGEKAVLMVTIANAGPGAAQDLHVTVKRVTMAGLRAPRKQEIGSLAAGASVTVSVPLEAVEEIASGQARLELGVEEKNGFDADSVAIEFETRAIKLPKLEVASVSLGGGGIVKLATVMPMEVVIKNAGTAAAKDVVATLVVGDQDIVISGDTTAAVGALEPGQSRSVSFEFFVKRRYAGANNLPVTVTLAEATGKRGLAEASLRLVMGKTAPSLKVVSIKGKAQVVAAADAFADVDSPPETPGRRRRCLRRGHRHRSTGRKASPPSISPPATRRHLQLPHAVHGLRREERGPAAERPRRPLGHDEISRLLAQEPRHVRRAGSSSSTPATARRTKGSRDISYSV